MVMIGFHHNSTGISYKPSNPELTCMCVVEIGRNMQSLLFPKEWSWRTPNYLSMLSVYSNSSPMSANSPFILKLPPNNSSSKLVAYSWTKMLILMYRENIIQVKNKIMQTIYCWEELFRPHEDLVPLFFQFYAGVLRQEFAIPHDYVSPYRPAQLKQYKKK